MNVGKKGIKTTIDPHPILKSVIRPYINQGSQASRPLINGGPQVAHFLYGLTDPQKNV